ncbi:MAG: (d)CMP kinase [Planctomycetes bacterium]|nr:(d)CMP kinase [Planctomycetota bacterium]
MIITIDGPAGAGKSTVAKSAAGKLGFEYLDTGAIYRAATLKVLSKGIGLDDKPAIAKLISKTKIRIAGARVFLDNADVTDKIRDPQITSHVFHLANFERIRKTVNVKEREFARGKNIVTEGRDQGSVVFKNADFKFYLDASPEERAKRRYAELVAKGGKTTLKKVLRDIMQRDQRDMSRDCSPLVIPEGAIVIDTTDLSILQVVNRIVRNCRA